ncbi:type 1 glutamine amidotransferase [Arcanobacterium pinnipediorum]|uniref:Lipid II isoglutaminyl synthase (glutamine-hydrolyzing) subunit GatD n=1 Tax=Arcanobacterium pinnipediorum TaxID=1503041 RepID=A0ABY5AHG6_9ACTO|nr:glutamine amidotransferase [Arcanobacterium pinnipediorum]USR79363.1 glutamine amidotransferase [Arcanobacterium pinnipediorum]
MSLRIGVILPEVLGTYGDSGNAEILAFRAQARGVDAEIVHVGIDDAIPDSLDIYTLGGGEDIAQSIAARKLTTDHGLARAVAAGRPVLAICAALQVLGTYYTDAAGTKTAGAGLLDVVTLPQGLRAIGELRSEPGPGLVGRGVTETLYGFENHGGGTALGPDATPFGFVSFGTGNGVPGVAPVQTNDSRELDPDTVLEGTPQGYVTEVDGRRIDGVVQGSIFATYMHGPVLARNPQLADMLISMATGVDVAELPAVEVPGVADLRAEREEFIRRM